MKTFITLAVVCFVAGAFALDINLPDYQTAKATEYYNECVKQENVSEEEALKLKNKDFSSPSQNMKCFGACFFEKVGALKDNQIDDAVVIAKLGAIIGEEKTKTVLDNCKHVKGEERCDTGFKVYECLAAEKAKYLAEKAKLAAAV